MSVPVCSNYIWGIIAKKGVNIGKYIVLELFNLLRISKLFPVFMANYFYTFPWFTLYLDEYFMTNKYCFS